jgi:hypothetical protein
LRGVGAADWAFPERLLALFRPLIVLSPMH